MLEGILEEVRWTVTPSEGKDSDSSDSEKHLLFLCFDFSVDSLDFFFPFIPPLLELSILLAL